MKIENIYDKHLQAIEEAEERVRVAKLDLQEAEKELDETLSLVEAELDEEKNTYPLNEIKLIRDGTFAVEIKDFKPNVKKSGTKTHLSTNTNNFTWNLVGENGEPNQLEPAEFKTKKDAEDFVRNTLHKTLANDTDKPEKATARVVSSEEINK